jgi:hypothetical protein
MTSLVADNLTVPRSRDTLGEAGTPRELTQGAPCPGVALGLAALVWASISAVALLLV